jgi:lipopolysaccharide/colanic/teichoic acid biosynthesis glycosyltransferase
MYRLFLKRVLDLLVALVALPFWGLVLLMVGPLIYLQDRGSVFYNAPRLGKDGKVFTMYKFRSMKVNAPDIRNQDGSTFNAETDPRLTKIGRFLRKTSLDETPQLLNVLKGDMSMGGPRPDLPEQRVLYEGNEDRKLEAKPGLTGYNQAYYRNAIPWKERIQNDIYYIDHMSFLFDFKILLRTIMAVFRRKGVFLASENAFQISDADAELANEGQGRG